MDDPTSAMALADPLIGSSVVTSLPWATVRFPPTFGDSPGVASPDRVETVQAASASASRDAAAATATARPVRRWFLGTCIPDDLSGLRTDGGRSPVTGWCSVGGIRVKAGHLMPRRQLAQSRRRRGTGGGDRGAQCGEPAAGQLP